MKHTSSLPACPAWCALPCAAAGLALLALTVVGVGALGLGPAAAHAWVGLLLLLLAALAVLLLRWEDCPARTVLALLLPIAAALYLRLLCLDHQTHDFQTFLSPWMTYFRENGGFAAIQDPIGDYNVPYLYILAALSYLDLPDLYLIKIVSILCDVMLAWAVLRLAKPFCPAGSAIPVIAFCGALLLPTVVLNGAYWAQCDSLYAALVLLAFSSVLTDRPKASVILLSVAFSFKLQTVFLIPLWCVFWYSRRVKLLHLLLFPVGYVMTILPALALGKPLYDILGIYWNQMGEYNDRLTLNAPSVFSFLPNGARVNTDLLSKAGILAAFAMVFALLILLLVKRRSVTPRITLTAAVIFAIAVPFLLPYMHERYFFLADMLTLVWACCDRRRIPIAALVQISSLSSYSTYLRLQYTLPLLIGGQYYVMAFEAALMLAALIWSWVILIRQLKNASA